MVTCRTTEEYCLNMMDSAVSWALWGKAQWPHVSCEAEYVAIAEAAKKTSLLTKRLSCEGLVAAWILAQFCSVVM